MSKTRKKHDAAFKTKVPKNLKHVDSAINMFLQGNIIKKIGHIPLRSIALIISTIAGLPIDRAYARQLKPKRLQERDPK